MAKKTKQSTARKIRKAVNKEIKGKKQISYGKSKVKEGLRRGPGSMSGRALQRSGSKTISRGIKNVGKAQRKATKAVKKK